jgi:hypothetical protein
MCSAAAIIIIIIVIFVPCRLEYWHLFGLVSGRCSFRVPAKKAPILRDDFSSVSQFIQKNSGIVPR